MVVAPVGYHVFAHAQKHQSGMAKSERDTQRFDNYNRGRLSQNYTLLL